MACLAVALVAACGDSVTGTTHTSPPLPNTGTVPAAGASGGPGPGALVDAGSGLSPGVDASAPAGPPPSHVTCTGKKGAGGDTTLTLTSGGYARDSLLHVPPSYDASKGAMLVVNYHGFSSNAAEQVALTVMNPVADSTGFIVAYPDGLGSGWNAGTCCTELQPPNVDDVQFTKDLLALIESEYCIDPGRVFATGFSNGGFMSHELACDMADTFAAIAPVSGVLGIPTSSCKPSRPVPVLDMHGTADPVVPYDGGPALKLLPPIQFMSVDDTMAFWRTSNGCLGAPTVAYQYGDATCQLWGDCNGGADVELCTLNGDGHQWPGSPVVVPGLGNESTSIDGTAYIVDWFVKHAK
jgi:polyhydroxybutyrate depolymerase